MPIRAGVVRRIAEGVVAAAALVLLSPIIALGAAVATLTYRASPFFVHERVGLDGRPFRLFKIRTLPPTTDRYADKYSLAMSGVPTHMKMMRRFHLDELPQLLNVVCGQMSLVGPRPEMPELHRSLPESFARQRTSVRPGLTCLWQISPHNVGLIGERSEYDRLYVDYGNPVLDLWILGQTARKMATGRTIHLHEVPTWAFRGQEPDLVNRLGDHDARSTTESATPIVTAEPAHYRA